MEGIRKGCILRNSAGECPCDNNFIPCREVELCPYSKSGLRNLIYEKVTGRSISNGNNNYHRRV